jgi:two-component system sensor histidine kinase UhpB
MSKTVVLKATEGQSAEVVRDPNAIPYSILHQLLETEKKQLARDLHDGFGQELTILKMGLSEIERATRNNAEVRAACKRLSSIVDNLIMGIRNVCVDLHPALLEEAGLFPTLEWYFERFAAQTGLECSWRTRRQEPILDNEKAMHIFRIIQEALTNAARHARAKSITVDTACRSGQFIIEIRDDGRGMAQQAASRHASMGTINMKERARLIGGTLNIFSSGSAGTLIRFAIPLCHCSARTGSREHKDIVEKLNAALAEQLRLIAQQTAIHQEIRALNRKRRRGT